MDTQTVLNLHSYQHYLKIVKLIWRCPNVPEILDMKLFLEHFFQASHLLISLAVRLGSRFSFLRFIIHKFLSFLCFFLVVLF